MRILYIDTRSPGHNAELHIDFISFMHKKGFCEILPYGNKLKSRFPGAININGLDLFPEETYIKYSADNVEKLCADVEYYIRNKREAKEKAAVLTNHVLKNHNHRVRAEQLMSFFRSKV